MKVNVWWTTEFYLDVLSFSALHEIPSQSSAAVAKMDERLAACLLGFFPLLLPGLFWGHS